jgi:hypothetical protein
MALEGLPSRLDLAHSPALGEMISCKAEVRQGNQGWTFKRGRGALKGRSFTNEAATA